MQRTMSAMQYNDRGNTYKAAGKLTEAIADFTQAININPNFANAYCNRGNTHYAQGKLAQAIADFTQAIKINPNFANAYYNRGCAYYVHDKLAEAISDFTQFIQIKPNYANAYNSRGFSYYKAQGKLAEAIADFTQAIKINPKHVNAYNNRGFSYKTQGKLTEAIADFTQAIKINPNYTLAYTNLTEIFTNKKIITNGYLDGVDKHIIFSAIKLLPQIIQISLLRQCVDSNTALGKRFWKQENFTPCSLEKGTLKKICDHLIKLDPNWVKPTSVSSDNDNNILLFSHRSLDTKQPEINPVFEHKIFEL